MLVYGCECWDLTVKAATALRAWNARRLTMITGREIREEYLTPAFNLLNSARARRLKWAGQLLRGEESFLPRRVALAELSRTGGKGTPGGIFQDAHVVKSIEKLIEAARNEKWWKERVERVSKGELWEIGFEK